MTEVAWLSRPPVALALLLTHLAGAVVARDALIGTWRGTSLCTNREAAPACADEQVIYDISATPGKADEITVKADKIVDGRREPMGEQTFRPDATSGRWVTEIQTPRVHALWYLSLANGVLSGGMTLLPSTTQVRKIELRRAQGSE
jgi:hypothetical protein